MRNVARKIMTWFGFAPPLPGGLWSTDGAKLLAGGKDFRGMAVVTIAGDRADDPEYPGVFHLITDVTATEGDDGTWVHVFVDDDPGTPYTISPDTPIQLALPESVGREIPA